MNKDFTNINKVTKTLSFSLIPVAETLDNVMKDGIITADDNLATSYSKMKNTIDEYHKWFINQSLSNVKLSLLEEYFRLYNQKKERKDDEYFAYLKVQLRKEVADIFTSNKYYSTVFGKDLIKKDLPLWINTYRPDLYFDESFKSHTTYFTHFNENRKNVYSPDEISTSICYRLINENLPKIVENINLYNIIKDIIDFTPIESELAEVLQGERLDEIFTIDYYNNLLNQTGIDFFNTIISGFVSGDKKKKTKGLNEYINEYNQTQKDKKLKIGKFKILYKQILADKSSVSFKPNGFVDEKDFIDSINSFYLTVLECNDKDGITINVLDEIETLFTNISSYDLDKIYLSNNTLSDISQAIYGNYTVFKSAINAYYDKHLSDAFRENTTPRKGVTKKMIEDATKDKEKWFKNNFSISWLNQALDEYIEILDDDNEFRNKHKNNVITTYFTELFSNKYNIINDIKSKYNDIKDILNITTEENLVKSSDEKISKLKSFHETVLSLRNILKTINCDEPGKDMYFYPNFEYLYNEISRIIPLYNNVRSFLTKKPYSTEKFKLNFDNSCLLDGWDKNYEHRKGGVLFRKDGNYYLGIINKKHNKIFIEYPVLDTTENAYEKINYKLISGANTMLPKIFFGSTYNVPDDILRIRNTGSHTKNGITQKGYEKADFCLDDCHKMIDYFKECIKNYKIWDVYNFNFDETTSYTDISLFYKDLEDQAYEISFDNIPDEYINEKVANGELYLFRLYNKDFSEHSKGTPNLFTIYWKALFDEDNLKNVVYKLNGKAEMFYRKSSIKDVDKIIHPKNQPIKTKHPDVFKTNTFPYDIVKDKRFTYDQFSLHVPITINYKAKDKRNINHDTLAYLQNNPDVNIIGIDRGERNLLYVTLINQKGEIIRQESLNDIYDEKTGITIRYHTILGYREKERVDARKNWSVIGNIKETKTGYLSQVVNIITNMMVEHNAIVVLEDLNTGFKNSRLHIDTQIYQAFEEKLIKKLNCLVFKNKDKNEIGGALNPLQLSTQFKTHKDIGKQSGFIFYVPAWNTSKIDPTTGFVNLFDTKFDNISQTKSFFAKFDSIIYNENKGRFEFTFDYKNFTNKVGDSKSEWTLCADNTSRYIYNSTNKTQEEVKIANELCLLFDKNNIDYKTGLDLKVAINSDNNSSAFYKRLVQLFKSLVSLRHNNGGKGDNEKDMIISPVENENGIIFNSDNALPSQPNNADANGALHIALKGLWVLGEINKSTDLFKTKLAITNNKWLQFVQNKEYQNI